MYDLATQSPILHYILPTDDCANYDKESNPSVHPTYTTDSECLTQNINPDGSNTLHVQQEVPQISDRPVVVSKVCADVESYLPQQLDIRLEPSPYIVNEEKGLQTFDIKGADIICAGIDGESYVYLKWEDLLNVDALRAAGFVEILPYLEHLERQEVYRYITYRHLDTSNLESDDQQENIEVLDSHPEVGYVQNGNYINYYPDILETTIINQCDSTDSHVKNESDLTHQSETKCDGNRSYSSMSSLDILDTGLDMRLDSRLEKRGYSLDSGQDNFYPPLENHGYSLDSGQDNFYPPLENRGYSLDSGQDNFYPPLENHGYNVDSGHDSQDIPLAIRRNDAKRFSFTRAHMTDDLEYPDGYNFADYMQIVDDDQEVLAEILTETAPSSQTHISQEVLDTNKNKHLKHVRESWAGSLRDSLELMDIRFADDRTNANVQSQSSADTQNNAEYYDFDEHSKPKSKFEQHRASLEKEEMLMIKSIGEIKDLKTRSDRMRKQQSQNKKEKNVQDALDEIAFLKNRSDSLLKRKSGEQTGGMKMKKSYSSEYGEGRLSVPPLKSNQSEDLDIVAKQETVQRKGILKRSRENVSVERSSEDGKDRDSDSLRGSMDFDELAQVNREVYRKKVEEYYKRLVEEQIITPDAEYLSESWSSQDTRMYRDAESPTYRTGIDQQDWKEIDHHRSMSIERDINSLSPDSLSPKQDSLSPRQDSLDGNLVENSPEKKKKRVRVRRHDSLIKYDSEPELSVRSRIEPPIPRENSSDTDDFNDNDSDATVIIHDDVDVCGSENSYNGDVELDYSQPDDSPENGLEGYYSRLGSGEEEGFYTSRVLDSPIPGAKTISIHHPHSAPSHDMRRPTRERSASPESESGSSCKSYPLRYASQDDYGVDLRPSAPSESSDRSSRLDPHTYQSYAAGLLHSSRKSERFLNLQNHYATLERIAEIEEYTLNRNLRLGRQNVNSVSMKSRSKSMGNLPTSEEDSLLLSKYKLENLEELKELYAELDEAQRHEEFIYDSHASESSQWTPWGDIGLRLKENSLHDLKSIYKFEKPNKNIPPSRRKGKRRRTREFRRELSFKKLFEKYRYLDEETRKQKIMDEFWSTSYKGRRGSDSSSVISTASTMTGSFIQIMENAAKKSKDRALYGYHIGEDPIKYEMYVENVRNLSQSCPDVSSPGLHIRSESAPDTTMITQQTNPPKRADSFRHTSFDRQSSNEREDTHIQSIGKMSPRGVKRLLNQSSQELLHWREGADKHVIPSRRSSESGYDSVDGRGKNGSGSGSSPKNTLELVKGSKHAVDDIKSLSRSLKDTDSGGSKESSSGVSSLSQVTVYSVFDDTRGGGGKGATGGGGPGQSKNNSDERISRDRNSRDYDTGRGSSNPRDRNSRDYDTGRSSSNPRDRNSRDYDIGRGSSNPRDRNSRDYDTGRGSTNPRDRNSRDYDTGRGSNPRDRNSRDYDTERGSSNPRDRNSRDYDTGRGSNPRDRNSRDYDTGRSSSNPRDRNSRDYDTVRGISNPRDRNIRDYETGKGSNPRDRNSRDYETGRGISNPRDRNIRDYETGEGSNPRNRNSRDYETGRGSNPRDMNLRDYDTGRGISNPRDRNSRDYDTGRGSSNPSDRNSRDFEYGHHSSNPRNNPNDRPTNPGHDNSGRSHKEPWRVEVRGIVGGYDHESLHANDRYKQGNVFEHVEGASEHSRYDERDRRYRGPESYEEEERGRSRQKEWWRKSSKPNPGAVSAALSIFENGEHPYNSAAPSHSIAQRPTYIRLGRESNSNRTNSSGENSIRHEQDSAGRPNRHKYEHSSRTDRTLPSKTVDPVSQRLAATNMKSREVNPQAFQSAKTHFETPDNTPKEVPRTALQSSTRTALGRYEARIRSRSESPSRARSSMQTSTSAPQNLNRQTGTSGREEPQGMRSAKSVPHNIGREVEKDKPHGEKTRARSSEGARPRSHHMDAHPSQYGYISVADPEDQDIPDQLRSPGGTSFTLRYNPATGEVVPIRQEPGQSAEAIAKTPIVVSTSKAEVRQLTHTHPSQDERFERKWGLAFPPTPGETGAINVNYYQRRDRDQGDGMGYETARVSPFLDNCSASSKPHNATDEMKRARSEVYLQVEPSRGRSQEQSRHSSSGRSERESSTDHPSPTARIVPTRASLPDYSEIRSRESRSHQGERPDTGRSRPGTEGSRYSDQYDGYTYRKTDSDRDTGLDSERNRIRATEREGQLNRTTGYGLTLSKPPKKQYRNLDDFREELQIDSPKDTLDEPIPPRIPARSSSTSALATDENIKDPTYGSLGKWSRMNVEEGLNRQDNNEEMLQKWEATQLTRGSSTTTGSNDTLIINDSDPNLSEDTSIKTYTSVKKMKNIYEGGPKLEKSHSEPNIPGLDSNGRLRAAKSDESVQHEDIRSTNFHQLRAKYESGYMSDGQEYSPKNSPRRHITRTVSGDLKDIRDKYEKNGAFANKEWEKEQPQTPTTPMPIAYKRSFANTPASLSSKDSASTQQRNKDSQKSDQTSVKRAMSREDLKRLYEHQKPWDIIRPPSPPTYEMATRQFAANLDTIDKEWKRDKNKKQYYQHQYEVKPSVIPAGPPPSYGSSRRWGAGQERPLPQQAKDGAPGGSQGYHTEVIPRPQHQLPPGVNQQYNTPPSQERQPRPQEPREHRGQSQIGRNVDTHTHMHT